ncbi:MAG: polysaccharide pyruvyl transferase family protein [Bryobacteraceae bacterium]|nr:polysaccharide pyruvyl transferase family protein [Bryobacteraceae bacterium]
MRLSRRSVLFSAFAPSGTLLLRSGWQTVNIGDIAHSPGVLTLLRHRRVILWSNALDRGVDQMLTRHFPHVRQVSGEPDSPAIRAAFEEASFFVHGSGPNVVAQRHMAAWRKMTAKPYGVLGVTVTLNPEAASAQMDEPLRDLLNEAVFVFTRETKSLANLRVGGVTMPRMGFVPDGTFSLNMRDDARGDVFLRENKLQRFLCVIPRLRYTPYHRIRAVTQSAEELARRDAHNEKYAETDHAKLRAAIIRWVRDGAGQVLLCPEMTYQLDIIDPLLYAPLPEDVKRHVVRRREYWLTDEAASIYARAAGVLSCECHSPIIADALGTPGFYLHQPEDGIKGQMWRDVGLRENYAEIEAIEGPALAERVLEMVTPAGRARVRRAVRGARKLQTEAVKLIP